jgi:hypothetical protein
VISPIGAAGSDERKHADMTLNSIIRPALSDSGTIFDVKRGDESAKIGIIADHLIVEILESDLIVADLSFLNPNVFYELGSLTPRKNQSFTLHTVRRGCLSITSAIAL